jgi:hypothetical protein
VGPQIKIYTAIILLVISYGVGLVTAHSTRSLPTGPEAWSSDTDRKVAVMPMGSTVYHKRDPRSTSSEVKAVAV